MTAQAGRNPEDLPDLRGCKRPLGRIRADLQLSALDGGEGLRRDIRSESGSPGIIGRTEAPRTLFPKEKPLAQAHGLGIGMAVQAAPAVCLGCMRIKGGHAQDGKTAIGSILPLGIKNRDQHLTGGKGADPLPVHPEDRIFEAQVGTAFPPAPPGDCPGEFVFLGFVLPVLQVTAVTLRHETAVAGLAGQALVSGQPVLGPL